MVNIGTLCNMKVAQLLLKLAFLGIVAASAMFANAVSQFTLSGNNTLCGASCPENVTADFTALANGDLQVVLSNFIDTFYDRQILTGIQFKFAGSGASAGTVNSQTPATDQLYTIDDATGTLTAAGGTLTAWHTELNVSPYITLTNLGGPGSAGGAQGIIGSATAGPTNNLDGHDPLAKGVATFILRGIAGIDGNTAITGANFNFGTGLDNFVAASNVSAAPEPGTVSMFAGAGLLLLAGVRRRRRR